MDWLQVSQIGHQVLGDRGGNLRKGYKVGDLSKNCDPDKSDTPLLHDHPTSPDRENNDKQWWKSKDEDMSEISQVKEKSYQSLSSGASSFSSKLSKTPTKIKGASTQNLPRDNRSPHHTHGRKPSESEKLLIDLGDQDKMGENWSDDEDEDDTWSLPRIGGYQKVSSGAD